jgi:(p)ppGpp synthase/HD superfamily hydrolase
MIAKMVEVVAHYHANQTDLAGKPYILHPLEVMRLTQEEWGYDPELLMIALGHDLIEDTPVTEGMLRNMGFSDRVVTGIVALTKDESKSYEAYKDQVMQNIDAMKVKWADLTHNTDLLRLPVVQEQDRIRTDKYRLFRLEILTSLPEFTV